MSELLLEIMCEEIPARMQVKAGADLARLLTDALDKAGLDVDNVQIFTGPRRLVFLADVPERSPDVKEERKGPRVGAPQQALAGFMRGAGLTDISQAETRSDKKGEYYVAVLEKPGRDAGESIAEAVPEIMSKFPWPKSMKSADSPFRWVRPLSSILCILDGRIVPFSVGGIESGNITHGHRRMGRGPYSVTNFKAYKNTLQTKGHVILSAQARSDMILRNARLLCAQAGLELVEDIGLLEEVAGLVEWPVVIMGEMDAAFLELPAEVIRLSMRTHQKYFALKDKDGNLVPKFIVVANQDAPDGGAEIARGNARVLSARLDDARFFQKEDAKRTLESRYSELDGVVFHQKLGTIKDKSERVAALARELAPKVGADPDKAGEAAKLAKCDLVTNMVVEFTSLQGKIGRLMYEREYGATPSDPIMKNDGPTSSAKAREEQEDNPSTASAGEVAGAKRRSEGAFSQADHADIAQAIEHHYKPQGPSDKVPTNPVAVAVALADKLDTLVGFWAIDEKPTGSKDPYALRRAALGVVRIILENQLILKLTSFANPGGYILQMAIGRVINQMLIAGAKEENSLVIRQALDVFGWDADEIGEPSRWLHGDLDISDAPYQFLDDSNGILPSALDFILDRLKVHLRDQGIKHDHIDAVFALGGDDLVDISNRIKALGAFLSTDNGANLLAGYKRAANILKAEAKKGSLPDVAPEKGTQAEEAQLFDALETAAPLIEAALAAEDYAGAMTALAELRGPIDRFFDAVTVNSDVAAERDNRLALLMQVRKLAGTIADFDKVEG